MSSWKLELLKEHFSVCSVIISSFDHITFSHTDGIMYLVLYLAIFDPDDTRFPNKFLKLFRCSIKV